MSANSLLLPEEEKAKYFTASQLALLNPHRLPKHVAIIPDGNGRWAKQRSSPVCRGHREGADTLMDIVQAAQELKIEAITFYTFSTENWSRPWDEVIDLMNLFNDYLNEQCEEMVNTGIRLETIGDLTYLPSMLQQTIERIKEATHHCCNIRLILALNYGSRNEIARAFKKMLVDYEEGKLKPSDIDDGLISSYLDTSSWPDPELLIRTSGELRLSNFLLWQISYAEITVVPVLWPDFTPHHLFNALIDFQQRDRRLGGRTYGS